LLQTKTKWKRANLKQYMIPEDHGTYTATHALRHYKELSGIHSIYLSNRQRSIFKRKKQDYIHSKKKFNNLLLYFENGTKAKNYLSIPKTYSTR